MTKERYKEIKDRNKNKDMMLCYEVFCEEKPQIPLQVFEQAFPQWFIRRDLHTYMSYQGDIDRCLTDVIKYLDEKYI